MTDDEHEDDSRDRLIAAADAHRKAMQGMNDSEVTAYRMWVVDHHDIVLGIFPSPGVFDGNGLYYIKGIGIIETDGCSTTALSFESFEQALEFATAVRGADYQAAGSKAGRFLH